MLLPLAIIFLLCIAHILFCWLGESGPTARVLLLQKGYRIGVHQVVVLLHIVRRLAGNSWTRVVGGDEHCWCAAVHYWRPSGSWLCPDFVIVHVLVAAQS